MRQNWWSRMEPAQRRKVALGGLGLLFITGPAIFATWWYMFSSTPPYQWFRENSFPTMSYPLLWIAVPAVIGFVILGVVLWSIRRENTASEPRFGAPEYYELLSELAEKKRASTKSQSVTLSAIAETAQNRRAFFPPSQSQKDSQTWAGIKSAWEEAISLKQEWQENASNPPLQKTEEYVNRTLAFAKENLTFDEIRKLDSPFEQTAHIFDPMRSRMDMVNYWWGRLLDYERHLQEIMQTFGRQTPVVQPQSLHDAVAHLGVIGAGHVMPLEIEWVPITKNKANQTQQSSEVVFSGNCLIGVHNPNRNQGVGEAMFTLLSISPPFENKRMLGQKLDDEFLKRIHFPIPGIQNNTLQGNQRRSVNLFTVTRPPKIEATLKEIIITFNSWIVEKRVPEQFSPTETDHILTVEVSGSGTGATEVQFRATFSTDQEESVLVLTKLTGLSEAEQDDLDKGNAMFLAIVDKIVLGIKPIRAMQQANAHELKTNDMLLQMRNDLIKHGHGDPFAPFLGIIPKYKWLGLLKSARYGGIDLGDEVHLFDLLAEAIPEITPPPSS